MIKIRDSMDWKVWKNWKKFKNQTTRTLLGRDFTYFKIKDKDGNKRIVHIWEPIQTGWKFLPR